MKLSLSKYLNEIFLYNFIRSTSIESISVYFVISTIAPELYHSSNGCKVKLFTEVPKQVRLNSFIIPETKSATLISGANVAKSTLPEKV